jgi:hypothetical protein
MGPIWDYNGALGGADYFCSFLPEGWHHEFDDSRCFDVKESFPADNINGYHWYTRLFEDSEFLLQYADRWFELRRGAFATAQMMQDIDDEAQFLDEAQARNFVRWDILDENIWPNAFVGGTYQDQVDWMKEWLTDRLTWMDGAIAEEYGAAPPVLLVDAVEQIGDGLVSSGALVTLEGAAGAGGTIYYTLDGTDPRLFGGGISPAAIEYTGPFSVSQSVVVTARLLDGQFSAVNSAVLSTASVRDSLRITEIMFNSAEAGGDFIELQNTGSTSINLSLVRFSDGIEFAFGDVDLAAGAYTVLVADEAAFRAIYGESVSIGGVYSGALNNGGDDLALVDGTGGSILTFRYEDDWYPEADGDGFSLTLADTSETDAGVWGLSETWRASSQLGGSPGEEDPEELPVPGALVINELLAHSDNAAPDWVEIYNTTGDAISLGGWFWSDDEATPMKYRSAAGTVLEGGAYLVLDEAQHFGNEDDAGTLSAFALSENGETVSLSSAVDDVLTGYEVMVTFPASLRDISLGRHEKSDATFDFVHLVEKTSGAENSGPLVGPVVFNDIFYNPDGGNQLEEYIELKNIGTEALTLENEAGAPWSFSSGIDFIFPQDIVLAAGGVLIVAKDVAAFTARFGEMPAGVEVFGPYLGQLSNQGEDLGLGAPGDGSAVPQPLIGVDFVDYESDAPWPSQASGGGFSLTRASDGAYGNDVTSWTAGTPSPGVE